MITKEKKTDVITANATHENDTGSPEVQVAIWTERIRELTEHLKAHPNDDHSRLGMYQLVGKRRRMLDYLAKKDIERYRALIAKLNIISGFRPFPASLKVMKVFMWRQLNIVSTFFLT